MKANWELLWVMSGFVGWICFFIQRAKAAHLVRRLRVATETAERAMLIARQTVDNTTRFISWSGRFQRLMLAVIIVLWVALVYLWRRGGFKFK